MYAQQRMAEKTAVNIGFVIFCTAAVHADTSEKIATLMKGGFL